jgi:hypothetical protein
MERHLHRDVFDLSPASAGLSSWRRSNRAWGCREHFGQPWACDLSARPRARGANSRSRPLRHPEKSRQVGMGSAEKPSEPGLAKQHSVIRVTDGGSCARLFPDPRKNGVRTAGGNHAYQYSTLARIRPRGAHGSVDWNRGCCVARVEHLNRCPREPQRRRAGRTSVLHPR